MTKREFSVEEKRAILDAMDATMPWGQVVELAGEVAEKVMSSGEEHGFEYERYSVQAGFREGYVAARDEIRKAVFG